MVYGETGRGVILNHIKCRMIGFCLRLVKGKETKHSCTILKLILQGDIHSLSKSQLLTFIANQWRKSVLRSGGGGGGWSQSGAEIFRASMHTHTETHCTTQHTRAHNARTHTHTHTHTHTLFLGHSKQCSTSNEPNLSVQNRWLI